MKTIFLKTMVRRNRTATEERSPEPPSPVPGDPLAPPTDPSPPDPPPAPLPCPAETAHTPAALQPPISSRASPTPSSITPSTPPQILVTRLHSRCQCTHCKLHYDESEYEILPSNLVNTTLATTVSQGRASSSLSISSSISHRSRKQNLKTPPPCQHGRDCEQCTLLSQASTKSRTKSRKSSGSSLARDMRREFKSRGMESAQRSPNIFTNIRTMFNKWLHEAKTSPNSEKTGPPNGLMVNSIDTVSYLNIACPQYPQECSNRDLQHAHNVMSMNTSFDSDYLFHYYTNVGSSICSTSNASTNGDCMASVSCSMRDEEMLNSARYEEVDLDYRQASTEVWKIQLDYDILQRYNPRLVTNKLLSNVSQMGMANSCPTKSKSLQSQTHRQQKDLLCSTWPPSGKRLFAQDEEEDYMLNKPQVIDSIRQNSRGSFELKEYEFNIPYEDIKFNECVLKGKRKRIYKGSWHGDVMIHTYENLNHQERSRFWEEISKLSLIRHENISLFMGASMDPPKFAVVTCPRKGPSLWEKLHVLRDKLSSNYKVSIVKDISQAAGYLHAKGVVIKRLTSRNIFVEPRAKLSLLDYSVIGEDEEDRPGYFIIPSSQIHYTAPEVLTVLCTDSVSPSHVPESAFTLSSDIYAFSIILFEIFAGRYPFRSFDHKTIMATVCSGKRDSVAEIRASETIRGLITDCWSHDPLYRPEFSDINNKLNNREASHVRHSSSEPENLHRLHKYVFF